MLKDFVSAYQNPDFQLAMRLAYERVFDDDDEPAFAQTRHGLCFPIEAEIVSKYGFRPARGVQDSKIIFDTPELQRVDEVCKLNLTIHFLVQTQPRIEAEKQKERKVKKFL